MRHSLKCCLLKVSPSLRRLIDQRDDLQNRLNEHSSLLEMYSYYVNTTGVVLQYREAHYQIHGAIAPAPALPTSRAWPREDTGLSYREKLIGLLPLSTGVGAEIGPLDIPIISKDESQVLYVDHLTTEGLQKKYTHLTDIVSVDRPMVNDSLAETLCSDAPLDFLLGSQVFEHVPNPIRWLQEAATVLRSGGLLALSLPDRRMTFDFLREETQPADIVAAYLNDATIPDIQRVYDHHSLASFVNMEWATPVSVYPEKVVAGQGSVSPIRATKNHLSFVQRVKDEGEYLDVHCWVFTPPSFLLTMAQLAADGFLQFRCYQFYPTTPSFPDRGNSSFTIILEKVEKDVTPEEMRRSFLSPLGQ